MSAEVHEFSGWEDTPVVLMARVTGEDSELITQASIDSITIDVYRIDGSVSEAVGSQASLTVADTVFDTLQTDDRWTEDATGYNFRYTVPVARFATPGRHRIEFWFTGEDGSVFPLVFEGPVRELVRS
jgi:hypothetical protein